LRLQLEQFVEPAIHHQHRNPDSRRVNDNEGWSGSAVGSLKTGNGRSQAGFDGGNGIGHLRPCSTNVSRMRDIDIGSWRDNQWSTKIHATDHHSGHLN
jgi:hypothetical protein